MIDILRYKFLSEILQSQIIFFMIQKNEGVFEIKLFQNSKQSTKSVLEYESIAMNDIFDTA